MGTVDPKDNIPEGYDLDSHGIVIGSKKWEEAVEVAISTANEEIKRCGIDEISNPEGVILKLRELFSRGDIACPRRMIRILENQLLSYRCLAGRCYWPCIDWDYKTILINK